MLDWYIPGISELPLGRRLLLLLAGESSFSFFCFLFYFVYVRVPRARHRGRARCRCGVQRALAGRGRGGRNAVAALVARRRVPIKTRGKHEWDLSGLLVRSWIGYVRVYKGRFGSQNTVQAKLIFATKLRFTERAPQSEHQQRRAGG